MSFWMSGTVVFFAYLQEKNNEAEKQVGAQKHTYRPQTEQGREIKFSYGLKFF